MDKTFQEAQADYEMALATLQQAKIDYYECQAVRDSLCPHFYLVPEGLLPVAGDVCTVCDALYPGYL